MGLSEKDDGLDALTALENDLGYYDIPEAEDAVPVSGWAIVALMDEIKDWRAAHASEGGGFNPKYCVAGEALTEHLRECTAQRGMILQEGWVAVPKEPTEEMLKGFHDYELENMLGHSKSLARSIYCQMLAAAPKMEGKE